MIGIDAGSATRRRGSRLSATSIALLVLVSVGAGTLFEMVLAIQPVLRIAGAACLIWFGLCLIRKARAPGCGTNDQALPETAWGVASFQLLNPKSWILVVTAISALGGTPVGIVAHP